LHDLSRAFAALYTDFGRPSIAPEKLLRAMLLQAFYGIRSERQLMEGVRPSVPLVCRSWGG
jgi:transposase